MVISDFQKLVADYMNRNAVAFDVGVVGQVDKLLQAANNAKLEAQRKLAFDKNKVTVDLVVNRTNGGNLSSCVLHGTSTPVSVHSIKRALIPATDGSGFYPVQVIDKDTWVKRLQRRIENVYDPKTSILANNQMVNMSVVKDNDTIQIMPWDRMLFTQDNITISLDVIQWAEPYGSIISGVHSNLVGNPNAVYDPTNGYNFTTLGVKIGTTVTNTTNGNTSTVIANAGFALLLASVLMSPGDTYSVASGVEEDFFIEFCTDWMLYRCIQELNMFLKEDQRVMISKTLMETAWESVRAWNARLETTPDDLDLE